MLGADVSHQGSQLQLPPPSFPVILQSHSNQLFFSPPSVLHSIKISALQILKLLIL